MRQRQRVYGRKKKRARKREERVKKADIVEALGFVVALQQRDDEGARGVDAEGEEAEGEEAEGDRSVFSVGPATNKTLVYAALAVSYHTYVHT